MATKTDRILGFLPGTFRALPKPTALHSVVNAFGSELLSAENSLAALMAAHWVDHADRGAELIGDLRLIAALYGLAPRPDETVEEFREHLKRYIRIFLEGTVTVRGIARVAAEALALRIGEDYSAMDTWWTRDHDALAYTRAHGADASLAILGQVHPAANGENALPAQVTGGIDLPGGLDLAERPNLGLKIDGSELIEIDLTAQAQDASRVSAEEIVAAINAAGLGEIAHLAGKRLYLASPQAGPDASIDIEDVAGDAAQAVLGLAPRVYTGHEAGAATVTGTVDLASGIDLTSERYLRLRIDGAVLAEIDCGGPNPESRTLDQIRDAINGALDLEVASHDGHFLALRSPTIGSGSSIAFLEPAAQNAAVRLFGPVRSVYSGRDAAPARLTGTSDLSGGVDLRQRNRIRLSVDEGAMVTVQCAGADPGRTLPDEIVTAINGAMGAAVARHNGRFLTLGSPSEGSGEIRLGHAPDDAAELILGIRPRSYSGSAARPARIVGTRDLSSGLNTWARYRMPIALDEGTPVAIDLRRAAADPRHTTLDEIAAAINGALGPGVAGHDGAYLSLRSPTTGAASALAVLPLETVERKRFATRAFTIDEATQKVFGFIAKRASGTGSGRARVVGTRDLRHGVDLREARFLRLAMDGGPAVDIDCAGARPRATQIDEVAVKINAALGEDLASHDGRYLVLASANGDERGNIAFEPARATDALDKLLGLEPGIRRGAEGTRVAFAGTATHGEEGIELPEGAAIKLGVDELDPVEIELGAGNAGLSAIAVKIGLALGPGVVSHDGTRFMLSSRLKGTASRLAFAEPEGVDATELLFGIPPGREYRGAEATSARVTGIRDLSGGMSLLPGSVLKLTVDGIAREIVFGENPAEPPPATLEAVVAAIDAQAGTAIASADGGFLRLTSPTAGLSSSIGLQVHSAGDAFELLFGDVAATTTGSGPRPATITGTADLIAPVDLSQRSILRLAVDGARPLDIDLAGTAPERTAAAEIVAAINRAFPGMASLDENDRLVLTSPAAGEESRLCIEPLRWLEVIEYPAKAQSHSTGPLVHGDRWHVDNPGAADAHARIEIHAPQGICGPGLVNLTTGTHIRVLDTLGSGETLQLRESETSGISAVIRDATGETRKVAMDRILAGPMGSQVHVPYNGFRRLTATPGSPPALRLNNPDETLLAVLRARDKPVEISVKEAGLTPGPELTGIDGATMRLRGRLRIEEGDARLYDGEGKDFVRLRPGAGVDLQALRDRTVLAAGPLHRADPPLLQVREIFPIFDVVLRNTAATEAPVTQALAGVTIGSGEAVPEDLVRRIQLLPSALVGASSLSKAEALRIPRGRSRWMLLSCRATRFNRARFDTDTFSGGRCIQAGIFNVGSFSAKPPGPERGVADVFAGGPVEPAVELSLSWESHLPGGFTVNLPRDLPPRFGGRFNEARFAKRGDGPESYPESVTEPPGDPDYLVGRINDGSALVKAEIKPVVPLGFSPVAMPFRKPRRLTLGKPDQAARIYLQEEGVPGFIELRAREEGAWGNQISVTARKSGPARFDVTVAFEGGRFENARKTALGEPLTTLGTDLLRPGPVGVLQGKAAGIEAHVTRE